MVNAVGVVLRDASSCPGAVMILFNLPNGDVTLRTGDFQADPTKSTCVNLGTTRCSPEYSFPSQPEVI